MRKITFRLVVLLLLVVALSFVFLGIFVSRKITEDSIVNLLEAERNLRMDIGELRAGTFGGKVVLSDMHKSSELKKLSLLLRPGFFL